MKKRMTIMIIALIIVFGGIIGFNVFKGVMIKRFFSTYQAPPVTVSSVTAIKKNWEPRISAVGNFVAMNGVEVNAEASGNVVDLHFESGQYIEKDKPLIDIDDSVEQALLKYSQADRELKDINYKRQTDLFKKGATPSSSVDEAKANLQQAQANVEKIEAQIKQKHIVAPFSGQLGIRQINLGQYIMPGRTSIVTLQSLDPLYLEFNLPEQLYKQVQIGQKIQVSIEEFPDVLFEGKISAINSKIDPNTHNILIQATLPNCPASAVQHPSQSKLIQLKKDKDRDKTIVLCDTSLNTKNHVDQFTFIPGMFASITIEQPSIANVIVLPSTSISYSLYGDSVFIIEKDKHGKKDDKGNDILQVTRAFVITGEQAGNYTVIKQGLKPGQLVVSSGELKLQNGTRVVINNNVLLNTTNNPDNLGE